MFRILLFLTVTLLSLAALAQQKPAFRIDSLPKQGILLDKGWKFHAGDNPDWAKPDFDDSAWEGIDPTKDIFDLPQISKNGQIGWFRLRLSLDESLASKQISLIIQQTGASEIYLNGAKIITNGTVEKTKIEAKDPLWKPFPINLHDGKQQVIAIRFALQPNILYTAIFENYNPAFWIKAMDSAEAVVFHYSVTSRNLIFIFLIIGISLMIFIIHFSFYLLYPDQKANLYFSLFSLFFLQGSLCQYFYWLQPFQVAYKFYLGNLAFLLFIIAYYFLLTAAYLFLEKKKDFFYYFLVVFSVIAVFLNAYPYKIGWQFGGPFQELFIQMNIARIAALAVRKKQKGTWIIAIGAFSTLVVFIIFLSQGTFTNTSFLLSLPVKRMIFYLLFCLSLPVSTSLFLAFQFADISKGLKRKIIENETLSTEKQQILATQNETLEKQVTARTAELAHKNRDLEIEASLEKVRSRSLSMHHSHEIQDVAYVMYGEFKKLNFQFGACSVYLINDNGDIESWVAGFGDNEYPQSFKVPYFDHPVFKGYIEAFRSGKKYETYLLSENIKPAYDDQMFNHSEYKNLPEKLIQLMRNLPSAVFSMAYNKYGALHWGPGELNADEANIIQRFSAVFEQAYTRFLDLQKAEAQAREAQIEVALERVRSKTMAMHQSNQLAGVMSVLCKEILNLGIHHEQMETCYITTFEGNNPIGEIWLTTSNGDLIPDSFRARYDEDYYFKQIFEAWKNGNSFLVLHAEGEKLMKHYAFLHSCVAPSSSIIEMRAEDLRQLPPEIFNYILYFSQGYLGILTRIPVPEYYEVFKRFGSTLQQAYTRFLDLQKAEAQAREAQIEAALEKVRSASLAIHQSHELENVVVVLFDKLNELGIPFDAAFIYFFEKSTRNIEAWVATKLLPAPIKVNMPFDESVANNPIIVDLWYALEHGEHGLNKSYKEKDKDDYYRYEAKHNPSLIPESVTDLQLEAESWTTTFASEKNSIVGFDSWSGHLTTNEDFQILKRFAKVFEQAYIRFLDLQKAEAQAREAQIEASLERVRSTSLAMATSQDLSKVVYIVFTELVKLDAQLDRCVIMTVNPETSGISWYLTGKEGLLSNNGFLVENNPHPSHQAYLEGWRTKRKKWHYLLAGEEKKSCDAYLFSQTELAQLPEFIKADMAAVESIHLTISSDDFGCLIASSISPLSEAHAGIVDRFTSVFNQTYTRFLDLQKAEAQAREAQIEVALERVRSRSMAMQHSSELAETASLLFKQVIELGVNAFAIVFQFWLDDGISTTCWASGGDGMQPTFRIPHTEEPFHSQIYQAWKKGENFFVMETEGVELEEAYRFLSMQIRGKEVLDNIENSGFPIPKFQVTHCAFFLQGYIMFNTYERTPEAHDIFKRFAKVFEQTYTRFLDLQKAEAQTKEAQIEAALEKIRSRSLAMHHSDELKEVMGVMFKKLTELEILIGTVGILLFDEKTKNCEFWLQNQHQEPGIARLPYDEKMMKDNYMGNYWDAKAKGESFFNKKENIEQKNRHFEYVFAHNDMPQPVQEYLLQAQYHTQTFIVEKNSALLVDSWDERIYSPEQIEVLKRVAKVFEQAYIRFLDLQKAEAQAREAQIEAALERVRSRTMAMQKSEELGETATLLFKQVSDLGIKAWTTGFNVWTDDNNFYTDYISSPQGNIIKAYKIDATQFSVFIEVSDAKKRGDEFLVQYVEGDLLKQTYLELAKFGDEKQYDTMLQDGFQFPSHQYDHFVFGSKVSLMIITYEAVPEAHDIFIRFGKVFEQTYTRFLDLQKAEAQAREAKIEAALEKIRSRSLAMHNSNELKEVMEVMFVRLKEIEVVTNAVAIVLHDTKTKNIDFWVGTHNQEAARIKLPYDAQLIIKDPYLKDMWGAKTAGKSYFNRVYSFEEKNNYFEYVFANNGFETIPAPVHEFILQAPNHTGSLIMENNIALWSDSYQGEFLSESQIEVLKRVAKVFEQAYIRFLDLQKAEAQTKEAQIEAALEKIRSRSLAMHHPDELKEVMGVMFKKLTELEILIGTVGILLFDEKTKNCDFWLQNQHQEPGLVRLPYDEKMMMEDNYMKDFWEAKTKGESFFNKVQSFEQKNSHFEYVFANNDDIPQPVREHILQAKHHSQTLIIEKNSALLVDSWDERLYSTEQIEVLKRVAKVFEQAYIRFLDLQKAEAQTREAKIEAALEKIRSSSLGMHHSVEIKHVVAILFEKLKELDLEFDGGAAIHVFTKDSRNALIWVVAPDLPEPSCINLPYDEKAFENNPIIMDVWNAKETGENIYNKLYPFEEKNRYFDYVFKYNDLVTIPNSSREFILQADSYTATFIAEKNSLLGANSWTRQVFSDNDFEVLKRIARVFEQAYIRFLDLQKVEAQALETLRRSTVDRVRAEIASMRTTSDLERITPLIWNELTTLGVPFIRCGVFIMDEEQEQIHTFLSTPDGKAIASFNTPFSNPGLLAEALPHWRNKAIYQTYWDEATFLAQAKMLIEQGAFLSPEKYLSESRPTGLYLHFIPFLQGMLYVGSDTTPLTDDQLKLAQTLADAFSAAYARYEDFNKLELAKKQVESTLSELKTTQTQLIQKEKLASLGELTAGIAHEIQNPLNFVNNFSELSVELISEINQERGVSSEERDEGLIDELLGDLAQNQEKINHHGKRASSIVSGMLEHSRTSTGERVMTDLNKLADEYLRLSYNSMRAKYKDGSATRFSADYELIADENLPLINVVPQDIGRVLLNLINNAFYAAWHGAKGGEHGAKVGVTTKTIDNQIIITVSDNGTGIPADVLPKIFQPFFTTKPTGEGTGLGLSLAYDIVTKGHGGTIEVDSVEGQGTTFILKLPAKN